MKQKLTAWLIVLAISLLLPVTAQAQETTLTTVVPSSYAIHLTLAGEGTVLVDGVAYTKSADIQVPRQHGAVISVSAADGSKVKTVLWDGEDVTAAFQNGKWTAPEILNDAALTVTFEKLSSTPQTGDTFRAELWVSLLMLSLLGIAICLPPRRKK